MLGAFDDNFMCGFCVAIPGVVGGPAALPIYNVITLGVLPEYRNAGAGRMLKLAQNVKTLSPAVFSNWSSGPSIRSEVKQNVISAIESSAPSFASIFPITTASPPAVSAAACPQIAALPNGTLAFLAGNSRHSRASPCPPVSIVFAAPIPTRCCRSNSESRASFSRTSPADSPSPALSARPTPAPTCFHHGLPNRPHRSSSDPDAGFGAFLRDQFQPHLSARHCSGLSDFRRPFRLRRSHRRANIPSITKSGLHPSGRFSPIMLRRAFCIMHSKAPPKSTFAPNTSAAIT